MHVPPFCSVPLQKVAGEDFVSVKTRVFQNLFKWNLYNYENYLWSKSAQSFFQFNLTLFTGVIAPNTPQNEPDWLVNQKSSCFFWIKQRATNTQEMNLDIQKVKMNGPILGYVRISMWEFLWPPGGNLDPTPPPPLSFLKKPFLLKWFLWDVALTLFDVPMDIGRNFSFWFSSKLGPNIDQNCKLRVGPIWVKICNLIGYLIGYYLWSKFQQGWTIFVRVLVQTHPTPPEKGSPFMDSEVIQKTLENFNFTITNARLIKLTTKKYLNKAFHSAKPWGITHRMYKGVNKNLAKSAKKSIF